MFSPPHSECPSTVIQVCKHTQLAFGENSTMCENVESFEIPVTPHRCDTWEMKHLGEKEMGK